MVHSAGVEPTTSTSGGWRSIQLSYECTLSDNILQLSDFSTPIYKIFQKKKKNHVLRENYYKKTLKNHLKITKSRLC